MAKRSAIEALKAMAIEKYEEDGGEMCECFSDADVAELLDAEGGSVEKAWAFHMRIVGANREAYGYYEKF